MEDAHKIFLDLFFIIILARFLSEIFARYDLPSVLGELLAGFLLGVSVFNIIQPNDVLKLLAEIGVILLLFDIGLKSDFKKLTHSSKKSMVVAISGAIIPFVVGSSASYLLFNYSMIISIFIGATLTATSVGITIRVLKDLHLEKTEATNVILGAAIIDDIIGIILLVFIYDFSVNSSMNYENSIQITLLIFSFLFIAPIFAKLFSLGINKYNKKKLLVGFLPSMIIALIFLFAYLSHMIGAHAILGSFIVGVALSRRFFIPFALSIKTSESTSKEIQEKMSPIINLFTPIFFVMVGLSIDLTKVDVMSLSFWSMVIVFTIIAFGSKFVSAFFIHKSSIKEKTIIGVSMIPRGEVGLIFAEMGRAAGILLPDVYSALIVMIVMTTVLPPILLKRLVKQTKN